MTTDAGSAHAPERQPHTPATEIRIFSLSERIGRVRYLVYFLAAALACSVALFAIYAVAKMLPPAPGRLIATLAYVCVKFLVLPLILCILTIRRLHDFNASGWWSLVPFAPPIVLAIPGTRLDNRFGPPPPPNSEFLNIAAVLAPIALLWIAVTHPRPEAQQAAQPVPQVPRYAEPAKPPGDQPLRPYAR